MITILLTVVVVILAFTMGFWLPYLTMIVLSPLFLAQWLAAKIIVRFARAIDRPWSCGADQRSAEALRKCAEDTEKMRAYDLNGTAARQAWYDQREAALVGEHLVNTTPESQAH